MLPFFPADEEGVVILAVAGLCLRANFLLCRPPVLSRYLIVTANPRTKTKAARARPVSGPELEPGRRIWSQEGNMHLRSLSVLL